MLVVDSRVERTILCLRSAIHVVSFVSLLDTFHLIGLLGCHLDRGGVKVSSAET